MNSSSFFHSPATHLWRAFFFIAAALSLLALPSPVQAQAGKRYRPQPDYVQLGEPDQAEGRKLLRELRAMGIPGDYYLEFQLRMMPRRGDDVIYTGRYWGGRRDVGAYSRIELRGPAGDEIRMLILTGPSPALWRWDSSSQQARRLPTADLFTPLGSTLLTPFDLQMPYLFWDEFVFEGIAKVRGRPGYRFLMYPPSDIAVCRPDITGVRVSMDTQYKALVESMILGPEGAPLKQMSLVSLKKTGEQWIVKAVEVLDQESRSKTRLSFSAAAMGQDFSDALFSESSLEASVRPPDSSRIDRF